MLSNLEGGFPPCDNTRSLVKMNPRHLPKPQSDAAPEEPRTYKDIGFTMLDSRGRQQKVKKWITWSQRRQRRRLKPPPNRL